ncbi:hypothetical protein THAOC_11419 [Thalassiosira oceanica]|uniref:Uncharacterized protein n=1 Tax=Thalassiosira oceanica TaxID=159749 RepID=K0SRA6_THAOC|nr:hypothetical protein THAOC_11419 [Thalassiosira oceanica]|eukprot:EJK67529.1 hypothetical protein THAOC_11419 [Thalassiosira oceanica]
MHKDAEGVHLRRREVDIIIPLIPEIVPKMSLDPPYILHCHIVGEISFLKVQRHSERGHEACGSPNMGQLSLLMRPMRPKGASVRGSIFATTTWGSPKSIPYYGQCRAKSGLVGGGKTGCCIASKRDPI